MAAEREPEARGGVATDPPPSVRPATPSNTPPAQRIAVVVNGNAKSVTSEVIETLDSILDAGDLFVSRTIDESRQIARILVDRGYGTILTGGGDGTFTVVVTAVVKEAKARGAALPRFGLLRLGTGNSLAWVLGASMAGGRGLAADLQRLRSDAGSRSQRLVECERTLSPFCGLGIDAQALKDYQRVKSSLARGPLRRFAPGPLAYAIAATTSTIPGYLVRETPHCRIVNLGGDAHRVGEKGHTVGAPIKAGSVVFEGPAKLAALSTIPYYGFGFRVFPYAEERKDKMHLRVSNIHPIEFVQNFRSVWRGEYENLATIFDYFVDDVEIQMDPPTSLQIGGDVVGERSRVRATLTEPIEIVDFYAPPRG